MESARIRQKQIETLLQCLPYETSRVTAICQRIWSRPSGRLSGHRNQEFIIQEYFRTDSQLPELPNPLDTNANPKWRRINGIGVRVIVEVRSIGGNLDLGWLSSLINIAGAIKAQKASGFFSIETFGLGGRSLTSAIPIPSEINPDSIAKVLATMESIKTKLLEPETTFISALSSRGTLVLPQITPPQFEQDICK